MHQLPTTDTIPPIIDASTLHSTKVELHNEYSDEASSNRAANRMTTIRGTDKSKSQRRFILPIVLLAATPGVLLLVLPILVLLPILLLASIPVIGLIQLLVFVHHLQQKYSEEKSPDLVPVASHLSSHPDLRVEGQRKRCSSERRSEQQEFHDPSFTVVSADPLLLPSSGQSIVHRSLGTTPHPQRLPSHNSRAVPSWIVERSSNAVALGQRDVLLAVESKGTPEMDPISLLLFSILVVILIPIVAVGCVPILFVLPLLLVVLIPVFVCITITFCFAVPILGGFVVFPVILLAFCLPWQSILAPVRGAMQCGEEKLRKLLETGQKLLSSLWNYLAADAASLQNTKLSN